uniref:4Fe-4S ferredoxin-type domain-containing protein n=1 Tax=Eucalyptus grandis TaxID=71139 RepID=A0A059DB71_EUCGR
MAWSCFSCTASIPLQPQVNFRPSSQKCLQDVRNMVKSLGIHSIRSSPVDSLRSGNWVKLICGASFEDVVDIRNLSLVYTLAGVDCIDCAADESVVNAVNQGIDAAREIVEVGRPWVMISVNDDEDLHFRKAEFDPADCPQHCSRPCEIVCPANAISLGKEKSSAGHLWSTNDEGVNTYVRDAAATSELLRREEIDALEIHTSGRSLWEGLGDAIHHLRLVAVSFPDVGDSTISTMNAMYSIMEPRLSCFNLWQLDDCPMSGDIGHGATRESIAFAVRLAAASDGPRGFLQLAGGTNAHTVARQKKHGFFLTKSVSEREFQGWAIDSWIARAIGCSYWRHSLRRVCSQGRWEDSQRYAVTAWTDLYRRISRLSLEGASGSACFSRNCQML